MNYFKLTGPQFSDAPGHSPPLAISMSDNNTTRVGRSLGGGAAEPLPSSWLRPSERPRVGRIGDWSTGGAHDDDDDDDDDENEGRESWFAGGERR